MVSALNPIERSTRARRRVLMELAGPAGVGKSTLARTLMGRLDGTSGTIWGLPVLPLLGNGLRLMPTFSELWLQSGSPLWDETRHIVRLRTLRRALERSQGSELVIFDEGPLFALTWLRGFGHEVLRRQEADGWWQSAIRDWASTLDAVVVLDAPDSLLAHRIRTRPHPHEVKDLPDPEIADWMARFRRALDWVLTEMGRHGGPRVVRLSADKPAEWIAEQLAQELSGSIRVH
jgi:energy-coupling factor transporter ATP-binding protein EcfA2